jgi:uncharacterized membrane protein YfcA
MDFLHLTAASPENWTVAHWTIAVIAALCIGLSKTGFGGVGTAFVLLMALIMGARASTGFILPMLLFADVFAVRAFHRHADWTLIRRLIPAAFLGIVVAFFAMKRMDDAIYNPVIGWIVLVLCGLQWLRGKREEWFAHLPNNPVFANVMGLGCGLTTMLSNGSGPIATLYFLVSGLPKMEFVGTGAWFFFLMNGFKVPFSWQLGLINLDSLRWNLLLMPAVFVGVVSGKWLLQRVPQKLFETLLLWFSILAALRLIFS